MNRGRVVALVGAVLHLPMAVMTAVAGDELVVVLTGPSLAAALLAVVGVVIAPRQPRAAAIMVLVPGLLAIGWLVFLGLLARGALVFLLGAPLLPLGGWLMRRGVGHESPMPEMPS